jgi:ubiquinone/menaquinone biosynthesis C-methylase UbiE
LNLEKSMSDSNKHEAPPPWNVVGRHDVFPDARHDEIARFNFLTNMNIHLSQRILPGMRTAYDERAAKEFAKEHQHPPETRGEMRKAMNAEPYYQTWSSLRRNTMEMRQQAGRSMVLRQLDKLNAKAKAYNDGAPTLQLDPSIEQPRYMSAVDIHCMPGSYHTALVEDDISAGANYDSGIFVTTSGMLGQYSDGGGRALADYLREEYPDFKPKRILDLGCTIGHNTVPLGQAFPDAEVVAIDTAAPVLRYAHARARSLGVDNITFRQANAEQLDYEDGSFDLIVTCMFLHELSSKALPAILGEVARLQAPGGLSIHIEQPQYTPEMDLFEQFMRDWDTYNNNEPFWGTMHDIDMYQVIADTGFNRDDIFTLKVAAKVDENIFPSAADSEGEDYGRKALWNAYGAWK